MAKKQRLQSDNHDHTAPAGIDGFKCEPDLLPLVKPTKGLLYDEHQARLHGDPDIEEQCRSLREHGQMKPIVVERSTMQVKAGNGTLAAARKLGWAQLAQVWSDADPKVLRRYALRDNKIAERSKWDPERLVAELEDLEVDPLEVGFEPGEIERMEAFLDAEPMPDMDLIDGTSTERKGQGVHTTMDVMNRNKSELVIIGDLRLRVEASLYERLVAHLEDRFSGRVSYTESFSAVLSRGLDES